MKRRKKWKAPNNPTVPARQLYRAIYGEPMPRGWRVEWAGFMRNTLGLTIWGRRLILLSYADARNRPARVIKTRRVIQWRNIPTGDPDYPELTVQSEGPMIRPAQKGAVVHTLIHEFTHLRNPGLRHGKDFDRLVAWAFARLSA